LRSQTNTRVDVQAPAEVRSVLHPRYLCRPQARSAQLGDRTASPSIPSRFSRR
jgi:hypothetical protein